MADNKSREVRFGYTGGDNTIKITDKEPGTGALTVKVNVDVSEALTGLKAIQREAREATKALRELESAKLEAQKRTETFVELDGKTIGKAIEKVGISARSFEWKKDDSTQSISDDIRRCYE